MIHSLGSMIRRLNRQGCLLVRSGCANCALDAEILIHDWQSARLTTGMLKTSHRTDLKWSVSFGMKITDAAESPLLRYR